MPVAGPRAADRAAAHYRWAERYTRAGETQRGLAHFGRALDFGGGEESGAESDQEIREIREMRETLETPETPAEPGQQVIQEIQEILAQSG